MAALMYYAPIIIIVMYTYHALINALSAHMIHINLNRNYCLGERKRYRICNTEVCSGFLC